MSLSKFKKFILKHTNKYFVTNNSNEISINEKGIQFLESELRELRLKYLLNSLELKSVIDIGASYGDFIHLVQEANSNIQIYGFEPISSVFNSLHKRYAGKSKVDLYNLALGAFDGYVDFNENDYSYSSSVLPIGEVHVNEFPYTKGFKKSEVKMSSLDSVFKNKNIERPLLVKVDVQGYEDKIISGGKNIFEYADFLIIELSFLELYIGQTLFESINKELNELGLYYNGCIGQLTSSSGWPILQQDALYIRKK